MESVVSLLVLLLRPDPFFSQQLDDKSNVLLIDRMVENSEAVFVFDISGMESKLTSPDIRSLTCYCSSSEDIPQRPKSDQLLSVEIGVSYFTLQLATLTSLTSLGFIDFDSSPYRAAKCRATIWC